MRSYQYNLLCLLLLPVAILRAQDSSCYSLEGHIPILSQPKSMDCWITVITMMVSWRDAKTYTIEAVAAKLGDPWKLYYDTNTGLPFNDQEKLIRELSLKGEPPANYITKAYLELLKAHGPLWITTGDGFSAHARLLIGIETDTTKKTKGDTFIFIDPKLSTGKPVRLNSLQFFSQFEEEMRELNRENYKGPLRIQIYHF